MHVYIRIDKDVTEILIVERGKGETQGGGRGRGGMGKIVYTVRHDLGWDMEGWS